MNHSASQHKLKFTGYLQPSHAKANAKPMVRYDKGGCDFRIVNPSSLGKQPISGKHLRTAGRATFAMNKRFIDEKYRSPGPGALGHVSSLGKQVSSKRPSGGSINFGTSSREGALKLYAIYTTK
ncbi:hypothetical protein TL16_g06273 [Triparma laevis f. inornata]|uniref:Uncharacterized protein n=2 Tax=Triparma laevis TaxID=1534972 RepID=A0A9W7FT61_9STRA|nr:hypothetical protein TL16_g06273 [Triparma laevis f. inornata]GMI18622.1 hypothetical protein TrLO_g13450 [Triparma laevis f. longispina]